MIKIKKSPTSGVDPKDFNNFSIGELRSSTIDHIDDVRAGLDFFSQLLVVAGEYHDKDKLDNAEEFYKDFASGFTRNVWWQEHKKVNRHHLTSPGGCPEDVNLIDVLDFITDCVMAGMARSGSVYPLNLHDNLLQRAFQNTVELLKRNVEVE